MALFRLLKALFLALLLLAKPASAQLLDPSFSVPTGLYAPGWVYAMGPQQADGQRLIAGNFTRINGTAVGQLVRLTTTGALDQAFLQNVGTTAANIYRVQRFPSGQYLLAANGGNITAAGLSRPELLRLNADGTADVAFDAGTGPTVAGAVGYSTSSAIQPDGKVVVAGYFNSFNSVLAGGIVRLNANGSVDPTFSAGTGVDVSTAQIRSVAVQDDGKILVGGMFTTFNGQPANGLVRLNANGSLDASFVPPIQNVELEGLLLQPDGKIVLYGGLVVNGNTVAIARLTATGSADPGFTTSALTNGYIATGFDPAVVLQPDGKLLVAGGFNAGNSSAFTGLARLNANGTLDGSFSNNFGPFGGINSVGVDSDGSVVVGGAFNTFNGSESPLQRFSGSGVADQAFTPLIQIPGSIMAVERQTDGKLLIAGDFTEINGQAVHRLTRLSAAGALDMAFSAAAGMLPAPVTHLVLQPDGKALAGTSAGLLRFMSTGSPDASFTAAYISPTYALALQPDGRILWGIGFSSATFRNLMRLTSTGAYDPSFSRPLTNTGPGVPGLVNAILVQPDGKIVVGGSFRLGTNPAVARVVRYDAQGALDPTFTTTPAFTAASGASSSFNRILSFAMQPDGKLLVGGSFDAVDGASRPSFARLNSTGAVDAGFVPTTPLAGTVYKVLRQPNGRVLLGGSFPGPTTASGSNLVRVLENGQLDASFGATTAPDKSVRSLLVQPDGAIVLAGSFTSVGGQTGVGVARIIAADVLSVAAPASVAAHTAVWPVPAHGELRIMPDFSAQPRSLALLDATGRPVCTRSVSGNTEQTLDLATLPTGLYLLQVHYAAGTVTRRIVVQ